MYYLYNCIVEMNVKSIAVLYRHLQINKKHVYIEISYEIHKQKNI